MSFHIHCDIVSFEGLAFSGEVTAIHALGVNGSLCILNNHAPLLAILCPCDVELVLSDDSRLVYPIEGGVLEVSRNVATIISDNFCQAKCKREEV